MRYFHLLLLLLMSAPIFAQTYSSLPPGTLSPPPATAVTAAAPTKSLDTNSASAAESTAGGYVLDDKYKLSAGDRVSIQILEDRDPAKSLLITDSGELDVPYIGRVVAANKTCKQLAQELKTQLEKEYYYRASVVLALDAANKVRGKVYIWGQVRNQGPIEIPSGENFTAGKAILRAGGFGDFAKKNVVKLIRTDESGKKQTFELNMEDILEKGKTEKDMSLQPDDFIIVPERLLNL
jgi:protein involved in polysaccharide export with SLBB domain